MEQGNANRIGPDSRGELRRGFAVLRLHLAAARFALRIETRYDPNQPRVPAGNPDGGQWTRIGQRVAQARGPRGTLPVRIGSRFLEATPGQQARYQAARNAYQRALREIQKLEPQWKPPAQLFETTEGAIRAQQALTQAALVHLRQLQARSLLPGRYSTDSFPARNSGFNFTRAERDGINKIGRRDGCHTCGDKDPGSRSGNFVPDHQLPSALNPSGRAQRLFPQCIRCSRQQGGFVSGRTKR